MPRTQENIFSRSHNEEIPEGHLAYWKNQLASVASFPQIPADYSRAPVTTGWVEVHSFPFSRTQTDELHFFCTKNGGDVYTILLSVFKILLYRYTNQEDILIGSYKLISSAPGNHKEILKIRENKLIVRTDLSGDPVFMELFQRVNRSVSEAEAHHDVYFFDDLKESLDSAGLDINSVFRVSFEYYNTAKSGKLDAELRVNVEQPITDLHVIVQDTVDGFTIHWKYNSGLYLESTIQRMASHFHNLLNGIISHPHECISKLPLLNTHERLQILFEWNDTDTDYQDDKCIHELFEEEVRKTPHSVALEIYDRGDERHSSIQQRLSYQRLNERANQLAHFLIKLGVRPDVVVGVFMNRSPELMIAILGILKAGGAYLPLNPLYPTERLGFMIADSGISILITAPNLIDKVSKHPVKLISLDKDSKKFAQFSDTNPEPRCGPRNLAYVIYTSGSTGVPKGSLILHRGVVNYLSWCIRAYAVTKGSGAPVNSSIAFDATVTSFFAPLLAGKKVVLLPEDDEIEALKDVLVSDSRLSLVKITPAHLEILRHLLPPESAKNKVNVMVIGGEELVPSKLEFWHKYSPGTRLINEYGPTETVVGCCVYEVADASKLTNKVPIGRPIANTQMYILDRHMEPVPIGVCGEIYIGGAGLARGYLNQVEQTNQRFVPNPFTDETGDRLFRTGDLGRYLPDGNIIYEGRIDHQVKIRGYRIELGEIESVLATQPDISKAVVAVHEDEAAGKKLVAYLVPKDRPPQINDIRLYLRDRLPEYMIPSVFVFLNDLPLTSNGKIDRKALPIPDQSPKPFTGTIKLPNTIQQQLVEIFERYMHLKEVRIDDDFFEIGGNSIQAAIIFSQIQKKFGKKLALSTLISYPTIEKLSAVIEAKHSEAVHSSLVAIQPQGSRMPLFCIHGGWGNVLFYRHLSKHLGNDQPLYGLQAKGLIGDEQPYSTMEEMAAHYIKEVKKVQPEGPYHIAGYCFGAIAAFEMAQQLHRSGEEVGFLASFNGISPLYNDEQIRSVSQMFRQFSISKKLQYSFRIIKQSLRIRFNFAQFHFQMAIRAICYKFYFMQGRTLPESLRRFYIIDAMMTAQKHYNPKLYDGNLFIFRSPKIFRHPHLGWSSLVSGEIKTIDIPGNHSDRRRIMYEPFVQQLAKEIITRIDQVAGKPVP